MDESPNFSAGEEVNATGYWRSKTQGVYWLYPDDGGAILMVEVDYALAWDFIDPTDGAPRQLRFRRNWAPPGDSRIFDGTGQLVAVIASAGRTDNGDTLAISRPKVSFDAVEAALEGWQEWAMLSDSEVNLAEIRRRIDAAGLGEH